MMRVHDALADLEFDVDDNLDVEILQLLFG
jgi:hypothetical protein